MSAAPPVTVGMPAFNSASFVAAAVRSMLDQSFGDFELLVIDDGSTDETPQIIESLAAGDRRIQFHRQENAGIAATRNRIVHEARGDLLAWMDSDDISEPQRLERQVDFLRDHQEVIAVGTGVLWIDPDGEPLRRIENSLEHEAIDAALLAGRGFAIQQATTMLRRQAVIDAGGYRTDVCAAEDLDLFLRLAERGRLANLPELLYRYRQHVASVSHERRAEHAVDHQRVLAETYGRRGVQPPTKAAPFRNDVLSEREQHRRWAWAALQAGYVRTARKHAIAGLRRAPFSTRSWRLAACALRGR